MYVSRELVGSAYTDLICGPRRVYMRQINGGKKRDMFANGITLAKACTLSGFFQVTAPLMSRSISDAVTSGIVL